MPLNNKQVRERVTKMSNAWAQGAPTATFKGITRAAFEADIQAAAADDQEIADMDAQIRMKRTARDEKYKKLSDDSIRCAMAWRDTLTSDRTTQSTKRWDLSAPPIEGPV